MCVCVDEASAISDAVAAISGDASNPSSSSSASGKFAGGRRVSVMGNAKTPPSMVAQLRNELAVMMAHINTTVRRDEISIIIHGGGDDDDNDGCCCAADRRNGD